MTYLIVGLGNPGSKYSQTRHNIGFMAVEALADFLSGRNCTWKDEFKAQVCQIKKDGHVFILVKPMTFMNLSGESVIPLMQFFKIPKENIIVIQDDIDQTFGSIKIQKNRGHGGHNGIRDISEKLGTADYIRLKLGVGRPPHPEMNVADYVLQKFANEEMNHLEPYLNKSIEAVMAIVIDGLAKASTQFNKQFIKLEQKI